jgi:hypothetical protein
MSNHVESLEERRLFAATLVHQELHRPPTALLRLDKDRLIDALQLDVATDAKGNTSLFLQTLINNGESFTPAENVPLGSAEKTPPLAVDLVTGDFNRDGAPDAMVFEFSEVPGKDGTPLGIRIHAATALGDGNGRLNRPRGSFVIPHILDAATDLESISVHTGDLDGDGVSDLVFVTQDKLIGVTVLYNPKELSIGPRQTTSQDGTFSHKPGQPGARIIGTLPAVQKDPKLELGDSLVSIEDGRISLHRWSSGNPTFPPGFSERSRIVIDLVAPSPNMAAWIGDFDADGRADDIALDTDEQATLIFTEGEKHFIKRVEFEIGGPPQQLLTGDLDGDGDDDFFTIAKTKPKPKPEPVREKPYGWGHITLMK